MNSSSSSVIETESYVSEVSSISSDSYTDDKVNAASNKMVAANHHGHDHNDSIDYLSRMTVLDMHYSPFMNKNFHLRRSYSIYADSLYIRNDKNSEEIDDDLENDESIEEEDQNPMHMMINKIIKMVEYDFDCSNLEHEFRSFSFDEQNMIRLQIIDYNNQLDFNLLHLAAKNNNYDICQFLISTLNFDKMAEAKTLGLIPFHFFIINNPITKNDKFNTDQKFASLMHKFNKTFELLMPSEHLLNVKYGKQANTAIHLAVLYKNYYAVELLLKSSFVKINVPNAENKTPLEIACQNDNRYIVSIFLNHKTKYTELSCDILMRSLNYSFKYRNEHIRTLFNLLMRFKPDDLLIAIQNDENKLFLRNLIESNMSQLLESLIEKLTKQTLFSLFERFRMQPFLIAAKMSNSVMFESLLKLTAQNLFDMDDNNNNIMHVAIKHNNVNLIKYMLNGKSNDTGNWNQWSTNINILLKEKNKQQLTPLLYSIKKLTNMENDEDEEVVLSLSIVKILVEKLERSILEHQDQFEHNLIHLAVLQQNRLVIDYLFKKFTNNEKYLFEFLTCKNKYGDTPLHLACKENYLDMLKLFIEEINYFIKKFNGSFEMFILEKNKSGKTCFHLACRNDENYEIVNYFLTYKLFNDVKYRLLKCDDNNEKSPLETAFENRCQNIALQLLNEKEYFNEKETKKIILENTDNELLTVRPIEKLLNECINDDSDNSYNFRNLDKELMYHIAISGQPRLLKHKVTKIYFGLKWRFLPRFILYFDLLVFVAFLVSFTVYVFNVTRLSQINKQLSSTSSSPFTSLIKTDSSQLSAINTGSSGGAANKTVSLRLLKATRDQLHDQTDEIKFILLSLIFSSYCMGSLQLIIEKFSFIEFKNLIDFIEYTIAVGALFLEESNFHSSLCSFGLLIGYIILPLRFEKLPVIGIYSIAFQNTFANSFKFLPIFLVLFTGFILTFNLKSYNFFISDYDNFGKQIINTLTMVIGEQNVNYTSFDHHKTNSYEYFQNFVIFSIFLASMSIIMLNLFVGIAVGEINDVLKEADLKHCSNRMLFIIKVENAIPKWHCLRRLRRALNIDLETYDGDKDFLRKFYRLKKSLKVCLNEFDNRKANIHNEKRLEDYLVFLINENERKYNEFEKQMKLMDDKLVGLNKMLVKQSAPY